MGRRADGFYTQEMEFACGWIFEFGVREMHMNCLFHMFRPRQEHPEPDLGLV